MTTLAYLYSYLIVKKYFRFPVQSIKKKKKEYRSPPDKNLCAYIMYYCVCIVYLHCIYLPIK